MADSYKAPAIPALPPKLDPQLRQFLSAIKETMEVRQTQRGNALDTGVNWRDLVDKGLVSVKDGANIGGKSYTRDQLLGIVDLVLPDWITSDTAPATPTGLTVVARQTVVELNWTACVSDNYGSTQVWRSSSNDLSAAVLVGSNTGTSYVDSLAAANAVYWYWIRHGSKSGDLFSPFNDVNGTPTVAGPSAPGSVSGSFSGPDYVLTWTAPTSNLVVQYYKIEYLSSQGWTFLTSVGSTTYRAKAAWLGDRQFRVSGVDVQGNTGSTASTTLTIAAPGTPAPSAAFSGSNAVLKWVAPSGGTLPVASYKVYDTLITPGALVSDQLSTTFSVPVTFSSKTYFVSAIDTAGNEGAKQSIDVVIASATTPVLSASIDGEFVRLTWSATAGSLPVSYYNLRQGASYAAGVPILGIQGTSYSLRADWTGSRTFWVAAVDSSGTVSSAGSVSVNIAAPGAPVVTSVFSGTQAVLSWTRVFGSLPMSDYEVLYGNSLNVNLIPDSQDFLDPATNWKVNSNLSNFFNATASTISDPLGGLKATKFVASATTQQGLFLRYKTATNILPATGLVTASIYVYVPAQSGVNSFGIVFDDDNVTTNSLAGSSSEFDKWIRFSAPITLSANSPFIDFNIYLNGYSAIPSSGFILHAYGAAITKSSVVPDATSIGRVKGTSFAIKVDWVGKRTFMVVGYDTLGNYGAVGSTVVDVGIPSAPSVTTAFAGPDLNLRWTAATSSMPVAEYEILVGDTLNENLLIYSNDFSNAVWTKSNSTVIANAAIAPDGTNTATKLNETNIGTAQYHFTYEGIGVEVGKNYCLSVYAKAAERKMLYMEQISGSSFPATRFDLSNGTINTNYSNSSQNPTFGIEPIGNGWYRCWNSFTATANGLLPVIQINLDDGSRNYVGTDGAGIYIWHAQLTQSTTFSDYQPTTSAIATKATSLGRVKGTTITRKVDWLGAKTFWLRGIDQLGNVGTAGSSTVNISQAAAPVITAQVIDNNVLLYWTAVQGTLPTSTYLIKKGSTWASAVSIGSKSGEFTTVFETVSGSYTYWIAAVDSAGNVGTPASVTLTVSQPPDYVLGVKWLSSFTGTKNNAVIDGTRLVLPVNTTEAFDGHFTARSWTTPQNQIDAGYPIFAQPGSVTGYYIEDRDYGQVLAAMKVTVDYLLETIAGSVTAAVTITTALDSAFTVGRQTFNGTQAFASNFRYVSVVVAVTGTNDKAIGAINSLSITLDAKLKTASGTVTVSASDVGGTTIYLTNDKTSTGTKVFLDVDGIDVTPLSTTPLTAVYDFVDTPNPLSFKALLFNSSGTRVSGTVSYTARGY